MTTIATDGVRIAADGRTTANSEIITDTEQKLSRLSDGSIIGGEGSRSAIRTAISELFEAELANRQPEDVPGNYRLLRLYPSGALAVYDSPALAHPQWVEPPFSLGSGGEFARGAMAAGASPRKAVKIAHTFDSSTGPHIQVMRR